MVSIMARPINDGGAFVILRAFDRATFIQIDIADECHLKKNPFESLLWNSLSDMSTKTKKIANSGAVNPGFETSTRKAILIVGLIFVTSLSALFWVYTNFPELAEDEKQHMKLPFHIEDAKNLGKLLERYTDRYYIEVLAGLFITYILWVLFGSETDNKKNIATLLLTVFRKAALMPYSLQTFAIPGSIFLSILSGFLFPFHLALFLVCSCSAIGASLCYLLSSLLGRKLLYKYFPDKANEWSIKVTKHKDHLLNYMLFLRMTPLLPNWFINLASPVIGVPMMPFTVGTFFGVAPPSFVAIQAGQTLNKLTSSSDAWSWNSIIILCLFALLSLVPVLMKKTFRQKFD